MALYSESDSIAAPSSMTPIDMLTMAVPGTPGEDYPIYAEVPDTDFSCDGDDRLHGGYYADIDAQCQVFHICSKFGLRRATTFSFLCPNGTMFSQQYFICDWWFNVDCAASTNLYGLNEDVQAGRLPTGKPASQSSSARRPLPSSAGPSSASARPSPGSARPPPSSTRPSPGSARPSPGSARPSSGSARPSPSSTRPSPASSRTPSRPSPPSSSTRNPSRGQASDNQQSASRTPPIPTPSRKPPSGYGRGNSPARNPSTSPNAALPTSGYRSEQTSRPKPTPAVPFGTKTPTTFDQNRRRKPTSSSPTQTRGSSNPNRGRNSGSSAGQPISGGNSPVSRQPEYGSTPTSPSRPPPQPTRPPPLSPDRSPSRRPSRPSPSTSSSRKPQSKPPRPSPQPPKRPNVPKQSQTTAKPQLPPTDYGVPIAEPITLPPPPSSQQDDYYYEYSQRGSDADDYYDYPDYSGSPSPSPAPPDYRPTPTQPQSSRPPATVQNPNQDDYDGDFEDSSFSQSGPESEAPLPFYGAPPPEAIDNREELLNNLPQSRPDVQVPSTDYGVPIAPILGPSDSTLSLPTSNPSPSVTPDSGLPKIEPLPTNYGIPAADPIGPQDQQENEYDYAPDYGQETQDDYYGNDDYYHDSTDYEEASDSYSPDPTKPSVPSQNRPQPDAQKPPTDYGVPLADPITTISSPEINNSFLPQSGDDPSIAPPPTDYGVPLADPVGSPTVASSFAPETIALQPDPTLPPVSSTVPQGPTAVPGIGSSYVPQEDDFLPDPFPTNQGDTQSTFEAASTSGQPEAVAPATDYGVPLADPVSSFPDSAVIPNDFESSSPNFGDSFISPSKQSPPVDIAVAAPENSYASGVPEAGLAPASGGTPLPPDYGSNFFSSSPVRPSPQPSSPVPAAPSYSPSSSTFSGTSSSSVSSHAGGPIQPIQGGGNVQVTSDVVQVPLQSSYNVFDPQEAPGQSYGAPLAQPLGFSSSQRPVAQPDTSYGAPLAEPLGISYGSPQQQPIAQPDTSYGAPLAEPIGTYGAPQSPVIEEPSQSYGAPQAPLIEAPSQTYGAPQAPLIEAPSQSYGAPSAPVLSSYQSSQNAVPPPPPPPLSKYSSGRRGKRKSRFFTFGQRFRRRWPLNLRKFLGGI